MNAAYNYVRLSNDKVPERPVPSLQFPHAMWVEPKEGMNGELGLMRLKDMYLPHFSARISEGKFSHDGMLENTSAEGLDRLGFCLFLKGSFETDDMHQFNLRSYQGTQNFKYDPQGEFRHRISAGMEFHMAHFAVAADFFMQFLPDHEPWADMLRSRIQRGERIMGHRSPYITVAQDRALQIVMNNPMKGKLGEMMIETAIQQIILLQLHSIFQQAESSVHGLSEKDRELMRAVKDYLTVNFLDDHSLVSLSRHFGVNTNKLMTLFKRLFGKSIFEFIGELRMDYARELLRLDNRRVADIARELGYKNANHFSTAYKKKFGMSPSMVR